MSAARAAVDRLILSPDNALSIASADLPAPGPDASLLVRASAAMGAGGSVRAYKTNAGTWEPGVGAWGLTLSSRAHVGVTVCAVGDAGAVRAAFVTVGVSPSRDDFK